MMRCQMQCCKLAEPRGICGICCDLCKQKLQPSISELPKRGLTSSAVQRYVYMHM